MLTKQDLNAVGNLMQVKLESGLKPIRQDIKKLRNDLKTTINFFDNQNLELRKNIDKTRKDMNLQEINYV